MLYFCNSIKKMVFRIVFDDHYEHDASKKALFHRFGNDWL